MNVLVTGATGFLGQHVVNHFVAEGYEVTALGRDVAKGASLNSGAKFVAVSLEEREKVQQVMQNHEIVIHCAAKSTVWGPFEQFYDANVVGTKNVVDAALQHGVKRFVHVSTPSIYFNLQERTKLHVDEQSAIPQPAINFYAHTKKLAEDVVDEAFQNGLPVVTIRPRALFGPGDQAIIPRLIRANNQTGVPFVDGGNVLTDVTYVENVVEAIRLCLKAESHVLGKKYNITNGEPMYLRELLEKVFAAIDEPLRKKSMRYSTMLTVAKLLENVHRLLRLTKEPVLTKYTVTVLAHEQTLNIDAARRDLQYEPVVSIDEGVERFARWWKQHEI